jgi:hydroxypyruvate reductase
MIPRLEPSRFTASSLQAHPRGELVMRVLASAFQAVEPGVAVRKFLEKNPLPADKRIFAFGLGKAAAAMTQSLADMYPPADSLIITKHASSLNVEPATVILGDHPIPGDSSLRAGEAARTFLSQLTQDDLLICLISGGGSALMTAPLIPLEDLQRLTSALLASGARIDEINTLRRHLDLLKGGGVVRHANGAQTISLILSDVVGDTLEAIASGPTAPDPSTREDALGILRKYDLPDKLPASIIPALCETAKSTDPIFDLAQNHLVGSNVLALQVARSQLERVGIRAKIIASNMQGEAREVGPQMATRLRAELKNTPRPFCLLAGGETTVTIKGNGRGGRNQELALSAVGELAGLNDVMLVSIATDGEDGPTDAAGAVVTGETAQKAKLLGLDAAGYLSSNDAHSFFEKLDDLIKTGPSGTNVNDLVLCFAF